MTVENHPGAGAAAAPAQVAKSPADGYTLLINTSAQAYSAAFLKNLTYDPLKDFIPVAPLTNQPYVQHLGVVKFNLSAGINAVDVPPRPTDAIADIVAGTIEGHTTYVIAPISIVLFHIREGSLYHWASPPRAGRSCFRRYPRSPKRALPDSTSRFGMEHGSRPALQLQWLTSFRRIGQVRRSLSSRASCRARMKARRGSSVTKRNQLSRSQSPGVNIHLEPTCSQCGAFQW